MDTPASAKLSEPFYAKLGKHAKGKGIAVSGLGIEGGEDCGITVLGEMAQDTAGNVNIVKPPELQRKMRQIIDNPLVATDVKVKIIMHPYLSISGLAEKVQNTTSTATTTTTTTTSTSTSSATAQTSNNSHVVSVDIGNANAETDIAFEFELNSLVQSAREKGDLDKISDIPFQIQIYYKKLDSTSCVRVISVKKPLTKKREVSEKHGNVAVLALATVQLASTEALQLKLFNEARMRIFRMQRLLDRLAQNDEQQEEYDIFIQKTTELDQELETLISGNAKKVSDKAAKVFYNYKAAPKVLFLAGTRKDISKRKKHVGEIKSLNVY